MGSWGLEVTIGSTDYTGSNTATISAVTTSKSIVLFGGVTQDGSDYAVTARAELTNATTVTAVAGRNDNPIATTTTATVAYTVLEFN